MTEQTPQRELFDGSPSPLRETEAHAPSSPAECRRAAAGEILGLRTGLQRRVLRFIRERGARGASDHEIAAGLDMLLDTVRARRVELRDLGAIAPSGRTRPTPSGRQATVWIVCPNGHDRQRAEAPTGAGHDGASTAAAQTNHGVRRDRGGDGLPATATRATATRATATRAAATSATATRAAATRAAARGARASGSAGVEACAWCGRAKFWLSRYGVWVCEHCHPAATPELVVDRRGV